MGEDLKGGFIRSEDLVHISCISYLSQGMSMSILGYDTGASRGGGEVLESFWQRASSHSLAYITGGSCCAASPSASHRGSGGGTITPSRSQRIKEHHTDTHRVTQTASGCSVSESASASNGEGTQLTPLRKALSSFAQFFL